MLPDALLQGCSCRCRWTAAFLLKSKRPSLSLPSLQMLFSACQQGAKLDVSFALVKATARPQVDRYAIFEDVCEEHGLQPCMGCGE